MIKLILGLLTKNIKSREYNSSSSNTHKFVHGPIHDPRLTRRKTFKNKGKETFSSSIQEWMKIFFFFFYSKKFMENVQRNFERLREEKRMAKKKIDDQIDGIHQP